TAPSDSSQRSLVAGQWLAGRGSLTKTWRLCLLVEVAGRWGLWRSRSLVVEVAWDRGRGRWPCYSRLVRSLRSLGRSRLLFAASSRDQAIGDLSRSLFKQAASSQSHLRPATC
ncbi:UNVERIFIED_CONTAM: hypothetical protein Sradi_2383100, partial [Sesamum radiatum]